ncbi:short chain dehydrogenase [Anaerotignum neopropionicum]|uniref:Short chain dehydrogenase n=1 Tax=Anaerotignum neopropionicum TaxID=36847 RepID=A0A136WG08_9FIRM|nr:alpha/beta hydrolase [Anaerotignum neopropionicum]KXL53435.1 short chain dehydrogenase [Anaerotignum neopropionicum]
MMKAGKIKLRPLFPIKKKIKMVVCIILGMILTVIVLCLVVLVKMSPGKIKQMTDEKGRKLEKSIAEKSFVKINDVTMGMIIKSKDISNPVLLFVHVGPGMPEFFLTENYPTGLEDYFTVVWWDQRGAGLSYHSDMDKTALTVDQYIEDTIAVTNYLRDRFGQEKIYLMAHSWGTYFGIQTVQKSPELYNAYIAVGQVTNQDASERRAHEYMLEYYEKVGNKKALKTLERNDVASAGYHKIRDAFMHSAGIGTARNMKSVVSGIVFTSFTNKEYTLAEKINLWRGKLLLNQNDQLKMEDDLREKVTSLDVPVYFFSGKYDYTVNYKMAEDYLAELDAPIKGFYLFENSAHSPIFEEPEKIARIIKDDVLSNTNSHADIK